MDNITTGALRRLGEGVIGLIRQLPRAAVELVELGAAAERQETALDNLARSFGTSGDEIVDAIQSASSFTIDRMTAMQAANRAMLLDVAQTPEVFERLTRVAVRLGQAMGLDATQSINDFVTAAGRQSIMIADNLGLTVKIGEATENYAAELGIAVDELTDAQKKQAFLNEMLNQGEIRVDALGEVTNSTATNIEILKANIEDTKLAVAGFVADIAGWILDTQTVTGRTEDLSKAVAELREEALKLGAVTQEEIAANKALDITMRVAGTSTSDLENRAARLRQEMERLNFAIEDQARQIEFDRAEAERLGFVTVDYANAEAQAAAEAERLAEATRRTAEALEEEKLFLGDLNTAFREFAEIEGAARLEQQQIAEAARATVDPLIAEKAFLDDLTNAFYEFAEIEGAAKMAEVAEANNKQPKILKN